ncbi:MAG: hypothetical protein ACR2HX_11990 [Pyrinomonadaceae bacterium]
MITQQSEITKRELSVKEPQPTKRAFVEPEISGPVDVLETTAFFQVVTGGTDLPPDVTP